MLLHFLEARVPLTKTFTQAADGTLEKSSYPFVKNFTSHEETVNTTKEFADTLKWHGEQGHCLLKGKLDHHITNESRAGRTKSLEKTNFLVFDLDGLYKIKSAEEFIKTILPPQFHNASYIVQQSASSGFGDEQLRCHIFFRCNQKLDPDNIKNWLTELNLETISLQSDLRLSANGLTLRYPLDRTVCQNDKLIYIAPPQCINCDDPITSPRIRFVEKENDVVDFVPPHINETSLRHKVDGWIAEIRESEGMPKCKPRTKFSDSINEWVLTNPNIAQVTDIREGRGFIYLNLNGGDSWAYYFNPEKPKYLYNFKGEPVVILKDQCPEFWAMWRQTMNGDQAEKVLVFRYPPADVWWSGIYDPVNDRLENMNIIGSRDKIEDFCANHNVGVPDPIPDWNYSFCPNDERACDPDKKFANRWQATEIMKAATSHNKMPPVAEKIIRSVTGDDEESYIHFINWLAYIYKHRTKTGTAWVLHGTEGTGKGLLFNNLLTPIFGEAHCITRELHHFDDKFNDYLETAILVNIDEARVDNARASSKVVNQIKHMITEPTITIRGMRQTARQVRSYVSFIFTSNDYDAMKISATDRRFNVAPRQENKIVITPQEVDQLKLEAAAFAGFLAGYNVDKQMAHKPLNNYAKSKMRKAGQDAIEQFCSALISGDLAYFLDLTQYGPGISFEDIEVWSVVKNVLESWIETVNQNKPVVVKRKDLLAIYKYAFDNKVKNQKFNRMLQHKNVPESKQHMVDGIKSYGIPITWFCDAGNLLQHEFINIPDRTTKSHDDVIRLGSSLKA